MNDALKKAAAQQAINWLKKKSLVDGIIGVGTGSTVNYFIDLLPALGVEGAVASSLATEKKLKAVGIPVLDLNSVNQLSVYVDGADEVNDHKQLIKGAGGALVREKIIATVAKEFACIIDASKKVALLGVGKMPLPIEVVPMARSFVARELVKLGGFPEYRIGFISDNGNVILDVYHLDMTYAVTLEKTLNQIEGVVATGLFAIRPADIILCAE
jgi:ribose 5-phosphate isomerase A